MFTFREGKKERKSVFRNTVLGFFFRRLEKFRRLFKIFMSTYETY